MKQYYYLNAQGKQMPPVDFDSLRYVGITADTMVWFEGLPAWTRAGDIPELQAIVGVAAPQQNQRPPVGYTQPGFQQPGYQQPNYQPGYGSQMPPMQQKPQSWLWLGICTTLLCCLPAGVVSIIYAAKVDNLWNQGRYSEAVAASNNAKTWGIVSAAAGVIVFIIYFFIGLMS